MSVTTLALTLSDDVRARLENEAQALHQSPSWVATEAIERWLENQSAKRKAVDIAIAEADAGRFISSEAMHRWIDSFDTDNELPLPEADVHFGRR